VSIVNQGSGGGGCIVGLVGVRGILWSVFVDVCDGVPIYNSGKYFQEVVIIQ